jgi:DNA-binding LacI/PurR family transcriptional regulator
MMIFALAEFFDTPLTTVHQPIEEIARKSAECLFEKMKHRHRLPRPIADYL